MIVDLLRNDLGRLMHYIADGDVQVDSLFDVETYETLLQMTSTITGKTARDALAEVSLHNFFKAIFPCGSITGAPKIRTMEIIDELEGGRRGVYTGAIGYMAPSGEAVFNVPIRTVVLDGSKGEMGIGSGIVHDSEPEQEWQECLLKGRFLTHPRKSFSLIETILWLPQNGFWLLDEHLHRLENSANYFLFFCDLEKIRKDLVEREKNFNKEARRVRLILEKDGSFTLTDSECEEPKTLILPSEPNLDLPDLPKIGLSHERVDGDSCWFYHKTTNRELYDKEFAAAQSQNLVDVIFCNQEGRVTEGCISNIIIYRSGTYCTPPVTDGLLSGVMRQYLKDNCPHPFLEQTLTIEDVQEADAVFLCNSVRGVVQVSLQC
jgi:para-aminobenzoate synthetase/4-amino-4-deoxychorismate lyase